MKISQRLFEDLVTSASLVADGLKLSPGGDHYTYEGSANHVEFLRETRDAVDGLQITGSEPRRDVLTRGFQRDIARFVVGSFGHDTFVSRRERALRFLEEALELVQAEELSFLAVLKVAMYVWDRPAGETEQEVGGVMFTLAALCERANIDLPKAALVELDSARLRVGEIRAKHEAKPAEIKS